MPIASRLLAFAFTASLAACTGSTQPDDIAGTDAASDVTSNADARIAATTSGVTSSMCAASVDLTAMGTLAGETTTIHGSTNTPATVMTGPCNPAVTGQQVFRYRVRGAQVSLGVTTALAGGTDLLDTIVWVLPSACDETSMAIACNDDDPNTPEALAGTSTLRTPVLAAGTDVTIVVGTYAGARRGAQSRGNFVLAVTEVPAAAAGAMCDSAHPGSCVSGNECASTSITAGVCVTASSEQEPNDTPAGANPITVTQPSAIHAAIMPAGDVDCFGFDAPGARDLYIEANDGAGSCGADLRLDLYRMGEMDPFDGDDDTGRASGVACPLVSGAENASVRALAAGHYMACIRASEPAGVPPSITLAQYSVHIAFE